MEKEIIQGTASGERTKARREDNIRAYKAKSKGRCLLRSVEDRASWPKQPTLGSRMVEERTS